MSLKLRRISHRDYDGAQQLLELRNRLGLQADIVSPRGKQLTEKVFGEALPAGQVVERICADVRRRGLEAVLHYTREFDGYDATVGTVRLQESELKAAHKAADPDFLQTVRRVRTSVLSFQLGLVHRDATLQVAGKRTLKLRYRPMKRVGICVPGGAAAYPSTLLMTVCPAQAAGVEDIAVVMPPTKSGAENPDLRAVCWELGVREVYRIGGAQAVAALAYGAGPIAPVDMIVGPGNLFVTLAKKHVYGQVAIDCLAGPSEVVVVADETARPEWVAADLIAQAEHDPGSSVLITWHEPLLDQVQTALEKQLQKLERGDLARASLESYGALVLARNAEQALAWTNLLGPEHLQILTRDAEQLADKIDNAGAIFVGPHTPVALGDYAAGPSHVLPTGGTSRFTGGLSAIDFLRRSSVLSFTPKGLAEIADDVCLLAEKEGLTGHAASVEVRLRN